MPHLNRIDYTGDQHGEDDVAIEVPPLCYGARHDGSAGGSEGALNYWKQILFCERNFLLGKRRMRI